MSHHGGAVTSPPWGPEQLPPQVVGDGRGRTSASIHPQSPPASSAVSGAGRGRGVCGETFGSPCHLLSSHYPPPFSATLILGVGVLLGTWVPVMVPHSSAVNPRGHLCSMCLVLPVCVCVGTTVPRSLCLPPLLPPLSASPPLHLSAWCPPCHVLVSSSPHPSQLLSPCLTISISPRGSLFSSVSLDMLIKINGENSNSSHLLRAGCVLYRRELTVSSHRLLGGGRARGIPISQMEKPRHREVKPCARGLTSTGCLDASFSWSLSLCLWSSLNMFQRVSWRKAPPLSVPTAESSSSQHRHLSEDLCPLGLLHLCHPALCISFLPPASPLSGMPVSVPFPFGGLSGSLQTSPAVFIVPLKPHFALLFLCLCSVSPWLSPSLHLRLSTSVPCPHFSVCLYLLAWVSASPSLSVPGSLSLSHLQPPRPASCGPVATSTPSASPPASPSLCLSWSSRTPTLQPGPSS